MFALFLAAYLLVAPTVMGAIIIALLTADLFSASYIGIAAVAGAVISIPLSWVLSRRLEHIFDTRRG
ncbi:hypothetical protein [Oricola sp.]|uniref:hypothetical protein n=1 Tax=Oricola sp. TaxID=1979950 RepID=UPI003BAB1D41